MDYSSTLWLLMHKQTNCKRLLMFSGEIPHTDLQIQQHHMSWVVPSSTLKCKEKEMWKGSCLHQRSCIHLCVHMPMRLPEPSVSCHNRCSKCIGCGRSGKERMKSRLKRQKAAICGSIYMKAHNAKCIPRYNTNSSFTVSRLYEGISHSAD